MIPLNKNPGVRPIGVGEVLRRIVGKSIARIVKSEVKASVGPLQVCAGHEAGSEAAVHAVRNIFSGDECEAVLLIDAANAFNCINREAFMHNVKVICPVLAIFVQNCYAFKSRLFIIADVELESSEGTTQGDPIAMLIYAIAIIPLILITVAELESTNQDAKTVGFADDLAAAGRLTALKSLWNFIEKRGPSFGYFPQATKTWLIVKPKLEEKAKSIFKQTNVEITTKGKKHLGAVIGHIDFKNEFMTNKVNDWIDEITTLSEIAKFAPQEEYTCFTSGYKHKLGYFMRTLPDFSHHLKQVDDVIKFKLIPAITGGMVLTEDTKSLFSLPPSIGGMGIPIFEQQSSIEFSNSIKVTEQLTGLIVNQERRSIIDAEAQ